MVSVDLHKYVMVRHVSCLFVGLEYHAEIEYDVFGYLQNFSLSVAVKNCFH